MESSHLGGLEKDASLSALTRRSTLVMGLKSNGKSVVVASLAYHLYRIRNNEEDKTLIYSVCSNVLADKNMPPNCLTAVHKSKDP